MIISTKILLFSVFLIKLLELATATILAESKLETCYNTSSNQECKDKIILLLSVDSGDMLNDKKIFFNLQEVTDPVTG